MITWSDWIAITAGLMLGLVLVAQLAAHHAAGRKASPYQRGDVVMVSFERDVPVKAIVLSVGSDYLRRRDSWIARYRVAPITKAGTWSKARRAAWPGFIERGYAACRS